MTPVSFSHDALIPSAYLVEIATSGALDEISNAPGAVRQYIRSNGLIHDGVTHKSLFFAIYQTGRHGPQNGFRLCIVHEGFEVGEEDGSTRGQGDAVRKAEEPITQGAIEIVRLGSDRGIDNSV